MSDKCIKHLGGKEHRAFFNILAYLVKKDPDYVGQFKESYLSILERHQAFWAERASERINERRINDR